MLTFAFERRGNQLFIWLDCAACEDFPPSPEDAPEDEGLRAGESLFF